MFKLNTILLAALTLASPAQAWPTGAGSCPKGEAAVNGPHMSSNIVTGTLEEAPQMLQVFVNGEPLAQDAMVPVDETLDVQIVSDMPFKGFLIRFGPVDDSAVVASIARSGAAGAPDFTMALNPVTEDDAEVKLEERYCIPEGVAGVCHSSASEKTLVAATLDVPGEGEYQMDVTVVVGLDPATASEYYFTSYMVKAMASATTDFVPPTDTNTTTEAAPEMEPEMESMEATEAPVSGSSSFMTQGFSVAAMAAVFALFL